MIRPTGGTILGVGVDLVEVDRFRLSLARTPTLVTRLFCEAEIAYAQSAADPVLRFAARFAVKEAVMKSLGVGLGAFGFHDVETVRAASGQPSLLVRGAAADLAVAAGVATWQVSISHTAATAAAFVVAVGPA